MTRKEIERILQDHAISSCGMRGIADEIMKCHEKDIENLREDIKKLYDYDKLRDSPKTVANNMLLGQCYQLLQIIDRRFGIDDEG